MRKWSVIVLATMCMIHLYVPTVSHAENNIQHETHVVNKGDTLWKIAQYYHCDFDELVELNPQFENPNLIHPTDIVQIPSSRVQGVINLY